MDDNPPSTDGYISDRELLQQHIEGDPYAFAELFTRHQDTLWSVALRTTGHAQDAEDALQEAMISAFRNADKFRGDSKVSSWLYRIVVNAALDRLRKNASQKTDPVGHTENLTTHDRSMEMTENAADSVDESDTIERLLQTLNPDQRAAIILVDVDGWSIDQAAALLGCAPGTVKSRCHRGRAQLARLLSQTPS